MICIVTNLKCKKLSFRPMNDRDGRAPLTDEARHRAAAEVGGARGKKKKKGAAAAGRLHTTRIRAYKLQFSLTKSHLGSSYFSTATCGFYFSFLLLTLLPQHSCRGSLTDSKTRSYRKSSPRRAASGCGHELDCLAMRRESLERISDWFESFLLMSI